MKTLQQLICLYTDTLTQLKRNAKSGFLRIFKIEQNTGQLALIKRYAIGNNPSWVEIVNYRG